MNGVSTQGSVFDSKEFSLPDLAATEALGGRFAEALSAQRLPLIVVNLKGDLGAGKTTFVRSVLRGLGHEGSVKSPTYTLVEEYDLAHLKVYHFDLYRLADPEELEFMGIRDFLDDRAADDASAQESERKLCFVEWPSRGEGILPSPDIELELHLAGEGRSIRITCQSHSQDLVPTAGLNAQSFFERISL